MTNGPMYTEIKTLLEKTYSPVVLEIQNESDMHSGPKGRESHFKVLIVSDFFKDLKLIERQKHVYQTLADVMPRIHALSLRLLLPSQMEKIQGFESPDCSHQPKK